MALAFSGVGGQAVQRPVRCSVQILAANQRSVAADVGIAAVGTAARVCYAVRGAC